MTDNTTELDFGTTAQKATDAEKLPVVLLALDQGRYDMARSLDELRALADANGMDAVAEVVQKRATPEAATLLGEGKVAEARLVCQNVNAAAAIFDGELTGSQIRNLSAALQVEVLDRTMLILEIFRARATTNEGKLQTELATLRYQLPRLQGLGESLSRQGGGGGGGGGARRGAGETKLELDRRHLHHRIEHLESRLKELEKRRGETRRARQKNNVPVVALVGYTNVGKSSLLNALCGEQIFEADMLFATLDTSVRLIDIPPHQPFLLSDTVGFLNDLPHTLIEAFDATLSEAKEADLLLHVVDAADPQHDADDVRYTAEDRLRGQRTTDGDEQDRPMRGHRGACRWRTGVDQRQHSGRHGASAVRAGSALPFREDRLDLAVPLCAGSSASPAACPCRPFAA